MRAGQRRRRRRAPSPRRWRRRRRGRARRSTSGWRSSCARPSCSPRSTAPILNAATMLGQSKTAHQAEIDAACESIDFWRWNAHFAERIAAEQPYSPPGMWNQLEARPLEGFVFAVTPFNFTVDRRQPADGAGDDGLHGGVEAGAHCDAVGALHHGDPARGRAARRRHQLPARAVVGDRRRLLHASRSGRRALHRLDRRVPDACGGPSARTSRSYRTYPRLVGETGGKDFILAHPSADLEALAVAIVRGGYEYQGQKCSAASRVYVPESLWKGGLRDRVLGADRRAARRRRRPTSATSWARSSTTSRAKNIGGYVQAAKDASSMKIVAGGDARRRAKGGWFVQPTLVESEDPKSKLMSEEIFGPVVTAYVYPDGKWQETLQLVDETSPYALTGAVFVARSRADRRGAHDAAPRGRQLLHQRQADRRRRRAAAVRRRARVGHERQGGLACGTSSAGSRRARSRRPSRRRPTSAIRTCRSRRSARAQRLPCRMVPSCPTA